jgi:hypothetical protein
MSVMGRGARTFGELHAGREDLDLLGQVFLLGLLGRGGNGALLAQELVDHLASGRDHAGNAGQVLGAELELLLELLLDVRQRVGLVLGDLALSLDDFVLLTDSRHTRPVSAAYHTSSHVGRKRLPVPCR